MRRWMLLGLMRRGGIVNTLCAEVLFVGVFEGVYLRIAGKIHILRTVGGQPNYASLRHRWLRDQHDSNNREIFHDLLPHNVAR
jgi:hypothetical protein